VEALAQHANTTAQAYRLGSTSCVAPSYASQHILGTSCIQADFTLSDEATAVSELERRRTNQQQMMSEQPPC